MLPAVETSVPSAVRRKLLTQSVSIDSQDDNIQTIGEDSGLGKVLIGIRFQVSHSCLEVRIVKGVGLRSSRAAQQLEPDAPAKPSTYCSVAFLPDKTEPVNTATVEDTDCPRWRGAFRFEKFPWIVSSTNQRCLQVQVRDSVTHAAMSEATVLLGNWSQEEYERGVRVWKYLNGTQETQRVSDKEGTAFLTLYCRPDRFKVTLHRVENLNRRWTAASVSPEFHAKVQAVVSGRLVKEATVRGVRNSSGDCVNFHDGQLSVRLSKNGHSIGCLSLRLVVTHQVDCASQEVCWLELGADAKRLDCRSLYQSVVENPKQSHVVSVRLARPPVPQVQAKREA